MLSKSKSTIFIWLKFQGDNTTNILGEAIKIISNDYCQYFINNMYLLKHLKLCANLIGFREFIKYYNIIKMQKLSIPVSTLCIIGFYNTDTQLKLGWVGV